MNPRILLFASLAGVLAALFGESFTRATDPRLATFSSSPPPIQSPHARNPNVLLITIDTLRADRLGCYGYHRPTSPHIDALAAQSVRFERAFSTSSFTPPSHASIMTSLYVGQHGLRTWNKLPDEHETLAETLKAAGYKTAASVNLNLLRKNNLGQGFDWQREELRDGRVVVNNAFELIRRPDAEPFFIWLHVYDVHRPYAREGSWARFFNPDGRPGVGDPETHYNLFPNKIAQRGLSEDDLKFIDDRYDAGIAYIDSQLGPLFAELNSPEHLANTMIVVTSDHGENLLDRRDRVFAHDPFLYQEVGRIPLIIRYPGLLAAGASYDPVVSLIDVAPTILETVGLPIPRAYAGLSLLPLSRGEPWPRQAVFQETWGVADAKAIRTPDRFVLSDRKHNTVEYFDLKNDPKELNPLSNPPDSVSSKMLDDLHAFARSERADVAQDVDPELHEKLKTLGYAGDEDDEDSYPKSTRPRVNQNRNQRKEP